MVSRAPYHFVCVHGARGSKSGYGSRAHCPTSRSEGSERDLPGGLGGEADLYQPPRRDGGVEAAGARLAFEHSSTL